MARYCLYTVLHFHWEPSKFADMSDNEKFFVIACIDEKIKAEENARRKIKK